MVPMTTTSLFGRFVLSAWLLSALAARPGAAVEPGRAFTGIDHVNAAMTATPRPEVEARPDTVIDDAGRFVATFPGSVQRDSRQVDSAVGKIAMNMVYHDGGEVAYMVIYSDYPAGSVANSGGAEKVCANASDGAVKAVNGTIRTSSSFQLGDVRGLQVLADIPPKDPSLPAGASFARLRFFVVGDRLFQVMYLGPASRETNPEGLAFLNSFRLTR
jgi:hypothetical protein